MPPKPRKMRTPSPPLADTSADASRVITLTHGAPSKAATGMSFSAVAKLSKPPAAPVEPARAESPPEPAEPRQPPAVVNDVPRSLRREKVVSPEPMPERPASPTPKSTAVDDSRVQAIVVTLPPDIVFDSSRTIRFGVPPNGTSRTAAQLRQASDALNDLRHVHSTLEGTLRQREARIVELSQHRPEPRVGPPSQPPQEAYPAYPQAPHPNYHHQNPHQSPHHSAPRFNPAMFPQPYGRGQGGPPAHRDVQMHVPNRSHPHGHGAGPQHNPDHHHAQQRYNRGGGGYGY